MKNRFREMTDSALWKCAENAAKAKDLGELFLATLELETRCKDAWNAYLPQSAPSNPADAQTPSVTEEKP